MCRCLRIIFTILFITLTVLIDNGIAMDGGYHSIFKRIISRRKLSNNPEEVKDLVKANTIYERAIRSDLLFIVNSLRRIQYLMKIADHLKINNQEFRFEQPEYNVTTTTGFSGLLTSFKLITTLTNPVQFGLLTDDAYVNQVFRVGPSSGILYADTKLKPGVYNFEVTADIIDLQLHATSNVTVNVTQPFRGKTLIITAHTIQIFLSASRQPFPNNTTKTEIPTSTQTPVVSVRTTSKGFADIDPEVLGNVNKKDLRSPYSDLWRQIIRGKILKNRTSGKTLNEKLLENVFEPRPLIKLIIPNDRSFRFRRAIPPKLNETTVVRTTVTTHINASVASIKIHQESALADFVMSSFLLFVVTFTSVIFFGSLAYFIYKRLKKCGDYSIDDDLKPVERPPENDIVMESEMKRPSLLCVSEIHQKRVTDSIEITKAKLQGHSTPSVFTIQRSYEAHQHDNDDDVFIVDVNQLSTNSDDIYNTITLQSYTNNTPAITATLIGAPPPVRPETPQSEERNGVGRKDSKPIIPEINIIDHDEEVGMGEAGKDIVEGNGPVENRVQGEELAKSD